MKKILLMALSVAGASLITYGQEPPGPPPPDGPPPPHEFEGPSRDRDPAPPFKRGRDHDRKRDRRGPPVEQWLNNLRKSNPEDFERLRQLRRDDPHAFMQEIQGRIGRERIRLFLEQHPEVRSIVEKLPESERNQLFSALMENAPKHRQRHGDAPKEEREIRALEEATHHLATKYRKAPEEEKAALREELRTKLAESFDRKEALQRSHVEKTEAKITNLKAGLEKRQANRDAIIDKRLVELTEGDPLAW